MLGEETETIGNQVSDIVSKIVQPMIGTGRDVTL